jgi:hypothetical protein
MNEPNMDLHSTHMASPQPRRMYTPIAPLPLETPRSHGTKRLREVEEEEVIDEPKRRKRSDSNVSTQFELSEEDKLLLQLKEEESMPWKDIAARFQTDLNKQYQIPALQMRLKRLRERMRVWTDTDVRALRMAHDYWVQNKFEIIAQKVSFSITPLSEHPLTDIDARVWRPRKMDVPTMLAQMARSRPNTDTLRAAIRAARPTRPIRSLRDEPH